MRTECVPVSAASLSRAASLLRAGEVVAFPTETVYGLGADALQPQAVLRIFKAKERPADNPLIAHIADRDMLPLLAASVPDIAVRLMDAFWPGPLTLILPKTQAVPDGVSAGLSTVAVRMPSHPAARALIREVGSPIAAPSANRSGSPSPTTAAHVMADLEGRIPMILDGGPCDVGLESTVLDLTGGIPTVLRPGGVTVEMLRTVVPDVRVDEAVLRPLQQDAQVRSPGLKHRHYAPKAHVTIVAGAPQDVVARAVYLYDEAKAKGQSPALLCAAAHVSAYGDRHIHVLGGSPEEMSAHLYDALRTLDDEGTDLILAEVTGTDGIGLALMNRLLRAANFDVVDA